MEGKACMPLLNTKWRQFCRFIENEVVLDKCTSKKEVELQENITVITEVRLYLQRMMLEARGSIQRRRKNGEAFLEKMTNRMISYAVLAVTQCPCRESFFRAVSNRMTSRRRTAHIFTDWDWASDGTTLAMNNMTCDVFFFISQAPFDCIHLSTQSSSLFMMGGTTGAAFQSRAFAAKVSTWRTYYSVLCLCFIPK